MAARTYAIIGTSIVATIIIVLAFFAPASSPNPPAGPFPYWTEGKPMSTPRTEVTGAAIDNSVYIVGGFDREGRAVAGADGWRL